MWYGLSMIPRIMETKIKESAKHYPVVSVTGPRQSGKTTLCRKVFPQKPYLSFEAPDIRELAKQDPRGFLSRYPEGAVLDEVQRVPEILSYLQGIVDERKKNGLYVISGSQNLLLLRSIQQSLAGRTAVLKLLPFSVEEIRSLIQERATDEILYAGFFPRIFDQKINPTDAMRDYVATYVERDVRQIINVKNLSSFQKFLKLCAGRIGQILNLSNISNDLGVSHTTIKEWMSVLEASYVIFLLPAYYRNWKKRLIKAPKLYFYDTGLAAYLLGIEQPSQMSRDPLRGALFENFVVIEFLKYFWAEGRDAPLYFFRDNHGNEVDLVIEKTRRIIGVEIKAGQTIQDEFFKGLDFLKRLAGKDMLGRAVVYGGRNEFSREGVSIYSYVNVLDCYHRNSQRE